jgi:hypothetical protein
MRAAWPTGCKFSKDGPSALGRTESNNRRQRPEGREAGHEATAKERPHSIAALATPIVTLQRACCSQMLFTPARRLLILKVIGPSPDTFRIDEVPQQQIAVEPGRRKIRPLGSARNRRLV